MDFHRNYIFVMINDVCMGNLRFLAGCPPPDLQLRGGGGYHVQMVFCIYIYI
jgi:hypothetical protein